MFQQTRKFISQLFKKAGESLTSQQSATGENAMHISRAAPLNTQSTIHGQTKNILNPHISNITSPQTRNFHSIVARSPINEKVGYEQSRGLSTTASNLAKKMTLGKGSKDPCGGAEAKHERAKKFCPKLPPCLTLTKVPFEGTFNEESINCGRICMPCCPPAYFPPICPAGVIGDDKVIERIPNPRPAYSEFPKDCIAPIKTCDCPPREEVCVLLPKIADEKC